MKILIIEDDESNRMGLMRLIRAAWKLDEYQLEIVGVSTLQDGLVEADSANVTILDLGLPDSHMVNTMEHIKRFQPPVIVLTGTDDPDIAASCLRYGADHVFHKGAVIGLIGSVFELLQKDVLRRAAIRKGSGDNG